jgi:hypothetical protein
LCDSMVPSVPSMAVNYCHMSRKLLKNSFPTSTAFQHLLILCSLINTILTVSKLFVKKKREKIPSKRVSSLFLSLFHFLFPLWRVKPWERASTEPTFICDQQSHFHLFIFKTQTRGSKMNVSACDHLLMIKSNSLVYLQICTHIYLR